MKKFEKNEIDTWRQKFVVRGYGQKVAKLDNRIVNYFVMPKSLFKGLSNGLFRMTGEPKDGYVVGVSDGVPVIIQPFFALSEHDEFMIYGLKDQDRTLHSEQNLLSTMETGRRLKSFYIENKLMLYNYILEHSKDDLGNWGFTRDDYFGFERVVDF